MREVVREETPRRQPGGKAHASREPGLGGESAKHRKSALAGADRRCVRGCHPTRRPVKCPEQTTWAMHPISTFSLERHYQGFDESGSFHPTTTSNHTTRHGNTTQYYRLRSQHYTSQLSLFPTSTTCIRANEPPHFFNHPRQDLFGHLRGRRRELITARRLGLPKSEDNNGNKGVHSLVGTYNDVLSIQLG